MIFYLVFILVWIGIIVLAKNKIKNKLKVFFNLNKTDEETLYIIDHLEQEYDEFKSTLDMNILSIKDELTMRNYNKLKIKKDIIEYKNEEDVSLSSSLDIRMIIRKTLNILRNLLKDLLEKIKNAI